MFWLLPNGRRPRSGLISNGFLAARAGCRIIRETHAWVCWLLRSGRSPGWTSLGSEPLGAAVTALPEAWHELRCRRIHPICLSEPEAFLGEGSPAEHEQGFDPDARPYRLSNWRMSPLLAARPGADLRKPDTFFAYLLARSRPSGGNAASDSLHERVFPHHAQL